jgi:hypothetical protein
VARQQLRPDPMGGRSWHQFGVRFCSTNDDACDVLPVPTGPWMAARPPAKDKGYSQ